LPTKSEIVINRVLSMAELSAILRSDFAALLARDGLLSSSSMGVGRVSYEIRLTLHLANPAYPEHKAGLRSARRSVQEVAADPTLAAIESALPLAPAEPLCAVESCGLPRSAHDPDGAYVDPDNPGLYHQWEDPPPAALHAVERHRDIDSPNLARIQHQMPVTVETRGMDGRVEQKEVVYPKSIAEGEGPQPVDTDVTDAVRKELGA
jgi:hypothetical protein